MYAQLTGEKRKQWLVGGVIILVVVILLGWWLLARNGRRDDAVTKSFLLLSTTDTVAVDANLELTLPPFLRGRNRPFTSVTARVAGDVQRNEQGVPELTGTMFGEARGRGNTFFFEGETRILEESVLFRLSELPVLLNPSLSLVEKWTEVDTVLLQTANTEEVVAAWRSLGEQFSYEGVEQREGERLERYSATLSPEVEAQLVAALGEATSGNAAMDVLARLLRANEVRNANVWLAPGSGELRAVELEFFRPLSDGGEFDFAVLELEFRDYGKTVAFERPEVELTVRPEVFSKLFGTGEVTTVGE